MMVISLLHWLHSLSVQHGGDARTRRNKSTASSGSWSCWRTLVGDGSPPIILVAYAALLPWSLRMNGSIHAFALSTFHRPRITTRCQPPFHRADGHVVSFLSNHRAHHGPYRSQYYFHQHDHDILSRLVLATRGNSREDEYLPVNHHEGRAVTTDGVGAVESRENIRYNLQLIVIDHYDSFTYNLVDMLSQICIKPPIVIAADHAVNSWEALLALLSFNNNTDSDDEIKIDGIILSPGPGNPTHTTSNDDDGKGEASSALAKSIIELNPQLPILGVCLGHQILGDYYGASIQLAPQPIHGQVCPIRLLVDPNTDPLWNGLPYSTTTIPWSQDCIIKPEIFVTRYHSLQVCWPNETQTLLGHQGINVNRCPLIATAISEFDQVNMAFRHEINPHYGVQFHPESIGSIPWGYHLLTNFCKICHQIKQQNQNHISKDVAITISSTSSNNKCVTGEDTRSHGIHVSMKTLPSNRPSVYIHKVPKSSMLPPDVMEHILAGSEYSYWLDAASSPSSVANAATQSRNGTIVSGWGGGVSILGVGHDRVEYFGKEVSKDIQGIYRYHDNKLMEQCPQQDVLTYLDSICNENTMTSTANLVTFHDDDKDNPNHHNNNNYVPDESITLVQYCDSDLVREGLVPFAFRGGLVGYLGYEVRYDTTKFLVEQESGGRCNASNDACDQAHVVDEHSGRRQGDSTGLPQVPTAAFLWADQSFVYDHDLGQWYLVGVVRGTMLSSDDSYTVDGGSLSYHRILEWIRSMSRRLRQWGTHPLPHNHDKVFDEKENIIDKNYDQHGMSSERSTIFQSEDIQPPKFHPLRSQQNYNMNFEQCMGYIRQGDSYELCLTNQLETIVPMKISRRRSTTLDMYKILRRRNPAPFAAFLNWGIVSTSSVLTTTSSSSSYVDKSQFAICCTSPERFVSVTQQGNNLQVEAKPIKGTCARIKPYNPNDNWTEWEWDQDMKRAKQLQSSIKDRAENLMIVDLLRNDLSRVCQSGTVHVYKLMDIESYTTVHQLVSTIRGTINFPTQSTINVLKACFPGGSMTGAPKIRTMELLHILEEGKNRGPYSGCLGYISWNGSMDMNIIIRTAILTPLGIRQQQQQPQQHQQQQQKRGSSSIGLDNSQWWKVTIGAGGAITALSQNMDEYEELMLKAKAILQSVEEWVVGSSIIPCSSSSTNHTSLLLPKAITTL